MGFFSTRKSKGKKKEAGLPKIAEESNNNEANLSEREDSSDEELVVFGHSSSRKQDRHNKSNLAVKTGNNDDDSEDERWEDITKETEESRWETPYSELESASKQQDTTTVTNTIMTKDYLEENNETVNSLMNESIMEWKRAAEEGSPRLRFIVVLSAIFLIVTSIAPFLFLDDTYKTSFGHVAGAVFTILLGLFICILESRKHKHQNPNGWVAQIQEITTTHISTLRMVSGRGILWIFAGSLHMAGGGWDMAVVSGGIMVLIGFIGVVVGCLATYKWSKLRTALSDDNLLWLEFTKNDANKDGYLNPTEFGRFVADVGLELDDLYTLKAFNTIDTDHDRKISFTDFKVWWAKEGSYERPITPQV